MVNQHNCISHINMSDVDPSTEPLLCCVNGDGCNMTAPPPPLSLRGESVSFCAPTHSIHLQSSYLGQSVPFLPGADPRTLLSPSQTTVSTPVPPASHVLVKESRVRFPLQEQQLPLCHTPELSAHVQHQPVPLWMSLTAAGFAPFVLPVMCLCWSIALDEHGCLSLLFWCAQKRVLTLRLVYLNCI